MTNIGITGHQLIPPEAERFLDEKIDQLLEELTPPLVAITSLAQGADQMVAKKVLALGGQLHVILPSQGYEATFADQAARDEFDNLLASATAIDSLDHSEPSEDAFLDAGHTVVDLSDVLVAIWDGAPARGKGGTADVVGYARARSLPVHVIWPEGVQR